MNLVRKLNEKFFGEATEVQAKGLTPKVVSDMQKEMTEYIKDWPTEAFNINLESSVEWGDESADLSESDFLFEMLAVKDFINTMADGINLSFPEDELNEKAVNSLMSFLKGLQGKVKYDQMVNWYETTAQWSDDNGSDSESNDWKDSAEVSFNYKIKGFKYNSKTDSIEIEADITDVNVN